MAVSDCWVGDEGEAFGEGGKGKVWAHRSPRPTETITSTISAAAGNHGSRATAIINIGVWGAPTSSWPDMQRNAGAEHEARMIAFNRGIERKVRQLGGLKWLYAQNWYSEEEFWGVGGDEANGEADGNGNQNGKEDSDMPVRMQSIYDKRAYDDLRAKWGADSGNMLNLWEKVARKSDICDIADTAIGIKPDTGIDKITSAWSYLSAVVKATIGSDHLLAARERKGKPV